MLMKAILFAMTLASPVLAANDMVCVRNYKPYQGVDVCEKYPSVYVYVINKENPELKICTRPSADFYCTQSPKEYGYVKTVAGDVICVPNFDQEPVLNYCKSLPDFYDYASSYGE